MTYKSWQIVNDITLKQQMKANSFPIVDERTFRQQIIDLLDTEKRH